MKKEEIVIERLNPQLTEGLTQKDVDARILAKKNNYVKKTVGKSYPRIFIDNIFTFFNFLGILVFVIMLILQEYKNMMFCIVVLANTVIGIGQEIRAKLSVQKLSLMSSSKATVIRQGIQKEINIADIVLDDVISYNTGKQIPADSIVAIGEIETNEALLTGESEPIKKKVGDTLLSGSFVVSGNCVARVAHVGKDNYAEQLTAKAKNYVKPNSGLVTSITKIIKVISIVVFPIGILTLLTGLGIVGSNPTDPTFTEAMSKACGSMIGMVPSGMVLLTSVALAVSTVKLVKRKVLVRDFYCIETLARTDVLCLDKTGTITDGTMTVEKIEQIREVKDFTVGSMIATLLEGTKDDNMTASALRKEFGIEKAYATNEVVPFSSARKYSAVSCERGTVVLGASEFVLKERNASIVTMQERYLKNGLRVMLLAYSSKSIVKGEIPSDLSPVALIVLQDTIREDAPQIIKWFTDNAVEVKIISGDNPLSVSVIANKVGVAGAERFISLDGKSDEEVIDSADKFTVFGRVSPEQKALLVKTLRTLGKTVAMTGDGVNDILAMRESNCAIAVASGSEASRSVAHLVLMDSKFSSMPSVVFEGRQAVNNIQNSCSLFLMKPIMTMVISLMIIVMSLFGSANLYPFEPMHLYIIEFFVIGIPAFLLALRPNSDLIKGKFIENVFKKSGAASIAMVLSVALVYIFAPIIGIYGNPFAITTVGMLNMTLTGLVALFVLCYPYDKITGAIALCSAVFTIGAFFAFPWLLKVLGLISQGDTPLLIPIDFPVALFVVAVTCFSAVIIIGGRILIERIDKKKQLNTMEAE